MSMKRLSSIIIFFTFAAVIACAQGLTMTGSVDEVVHVGDNFRLRYTVNSTDVEDFQLGQMPSAIDVVFGPSQSTSISSVYTNGHGSTTRTLTLTFVLTAKEEGQFTIPPASANVEGHTVRSKALTVHVVESGAQAAQQSRAGQRTSSEYFFVLATPTKRRVVEYEPFLLTYKVCWHHDVPVINLDDINLELQNVYMQPFNDTQQKSKKVEQIGGRTFVTVDWKQYVIYPQKSGTLHIPSMSFMGYVRQEMNIDPYDPFSSTYREIPQQLVTPEVNIQVDPLPERPVDFSGGVGRLSMTAQTDKTSLQANTPLTLTVTVSGRGNLNMLKTPIVEFPSSFDTYDPKQSENFNVTAEGISGNITYELIAVPQREGTYTIPPVRMVYYDIDAREYKTLATDSFHISVTPGAAGQSTMNDYSGSEAHRGDIMPIRTGPGQASENGSSTFFASAFYWGCMAALVLLAIIIFVILRLTVFKQSDMEKSRAGRANRVATRRLRKAAQLMKAGKPQAFYDETLRALWGYVGDKLNIPVSELSRENVCQRLSERGISEEVTSRFIEAIDECEYVRYAPGDPEGNMSKVYDKSMTAIEQIESMKKKMKPAKGMAVLVLISIFCFFSSIDAAAQSKVQGDEAFSQGDYETAISIYHHVLADHPNDAAVCYNIGNAYYRQGDMAHAILYYERALLLQPGDDDARFNLQLACSKTIDNIAPEREMFFVTWYHSLASLFSVDTWAIVALVTLALTLILGLLYYFASAIALRKAAFFSSLVLLLVFVLSNVFAMQQRQSLMNRHDGIIMVSEVGVNSTPTDGVAEEFTLHAGTKVSVIDSTMQGWLQVSVADGRQGWLRADAVEMI